ncbi:MAG: DUF3419 family protein [Clostridia bacterium]|nr:DUF3419 family protein [Clostridia bacterium]
MFDKEYLNNPDYNMALEKFFEPSLYNGNNPYRNGTIDRAYPFSNERLCDMAKLFRNKKRVLTVGSSGDQALNSIYYGAKDVDITIMDADIFTKYYVDYKIATIKNLDFDTFTKFFIDFEKPFIYNVHKKIFQDMDEESQAFWATIFLEGGDTELRQRLLKTNDLFDEQIQSEFYKSERAYKTLQHKLRQGNYSLNYETAEFNEFPQAAEGKYDLIMLSNIYDYVSDSEFKKVVNSLHANNLSPNGKIQLHYIFGCYDSVGVDDTINTVEYLKQRVFDGKKTIKEHRLKENCKTYIMSKSLDIHEM